MSRQREMLLLSLLFATLYFVQGVAEPTEGLIAQPVRAQLRYLQVPTREIATFSALIGLPWSLKPLFGLLSDCLPIFGSRRRSYLILSTLATTTGLTILLAIPFDVVNLRSIFGCIYLATLGVAIADVVVDALAVAAGQRHGLTGRFQAIQWGSLYLAGILTGSLGGTLSERRIPQVGFLICGLLAAVSLLMTLLFVAEEREGPAKVTEKPTLQNALRSLWTTATSPLIWTVGAFLFLWNFNPFSSAVQEAYMGNELHLDQQLIGHTRSISSFGSILACAGYAVFAPRIPARWLVHGSIAAGVASSLVYLLMFDLWSAVAVSLVSGLFYMWGTLVQLDLAARVCRAESAGTTFATLMALSNTGMFAGIYLGGTWYEGLSLYFGGASYAYGVLVIIGGLFTAACWLLVPALRWPGDTPLVPSRAERKIEA